MSILVVIVWGNMRQPRRRRRWTNRHAREEGAQTNRYPGGGGPGSDRRSGRQVDGGCLKGNRQFGDPVLPRSHHRSPPPPRPGLPVGASVRPGRSWLRPVRPRSPAGTNSLHVARRRRSTARRVTASARARGGRAETAGASFVDVAWQPRWCCWATPADCSLS